MEDVLKVIAKSVYCSKVVNIFLVTVSQLPCLGTHSDIIILIACRDDVFYRTRKKVTGIL